jgi:hypothetical protein
MAIFLYGESHKPALENTSVSAAGDNLGPTVELVPPSGMNAGDLVIIIAVNRQSGIPSLSVTGGQTWTSNAGDTSTGNLRPRSFTCVFNGTWTANPVVTNGAAVSMQASMFVFRSNNLSPGFAADVAETTQANAAPTTPFSVSSPTFNPAAGALSFAWWACTDNEPFDTPVGVGAWNGSSWRSGAGSSSSIGWAFNANSSTGSQSVSVTQGLRGGARNSSVSGAFAFTETGSPTTRQGFQPYMLPTPGHT